MFSQVQIHSLVNKWYVITIYSRRSSIFDVLWVYFP